MKKRVRWQITGQSNDGVVKIVAKSLSSTFYALKLFLTPEDNALVEMMKNGGPVKDHIGKPIDEAFFRKWQTPHALVGAALLELRLRDNGVLLAIENGDRLVVRTTSKTTWVGLFGVVEK